MRRFRLVSPRDQKGSGWLTISTSERKVLVDDEPLNLGLTDRFEDHRAASRLSFSIRQRFKSFFSEETVDPGGYRNSLVKHTLLPPTKNA